MRIIGLRVYWPSTYSLLSLYSIFAHEADATNLDEMIYEYKLIRLN